DRAHPRHRTRSPDAHVLRPTMGKLCLRNDAETLRLPLVSLGGEVRAGGTPHSHLVGRTHAVRRVPLPLARRSLTMPRIHLSRRTVVQGAGSVAIALPWLEAMGSLSVARAATFAKR